MATTTPLRESSPATTTIKPMKESSVSASFGTLPTLPQLLVAIGSGIVFGLVMERSLVGYPATIRGQFDFTHNSMMKIFLAGCGMTALIFSALARYDRKAFDDLRRKRGATDKGASTLLIGGALQGAGLVLCGACPGTIHVQLGAGVPGAIYSWLGGLAGAFAYTMIHPAIRALQHRDYKSTSGKWLSSVLIDEHASFDYPKAASVAGVLLLSAAFALDWFVPFGVDAVHDIPGARTVEQGLLSPVFAGAILGALQLPLFFSMRTFLGSSTMYSVVSSQWLNFAGTSIRENFTYGCCYVRGQEAWQVAFAVGAVLGGALSSGAISTPFQPNRMPILDGVGKNFDVIGGFLLVLGARISGGCTSGLGLTGLPLLLFSSYVGIPAIFAGGFAATGALKLAGV
jgi:uncharacterized membrane protein YedE/YeeE